MYIHIYILYSFGHIYMYVFTLLFYFPVEPDFVRISQLLEGSAVSNF